MIDSARFAFCLALICSACTQTASSVGSIQSDLDHNPKIHDKGYTVAVQSFDHGYLTLSVKGLRPNAARALEKGDDLMTIAWTKEGNVSVLMEAEGMLKRRGDVKGVKWVPAP